MKRAVLLLGALWASHTSLAAQSASTLDDVLERLGTYLANYSEQLSRTVASERYKQTTGSGPTYSEALLESEFGVVKVPDYEGWLGFRDVLRVNGRPVQDHESRLQDLLLSPAPVPIDQAWRITEESARRNIGPVQRNINNPALVLLLFDRKNHHRLRFTKADEDTIDQTRVWVIRYEEQTKPTIIKTPQGGDVSTEGYAWVDPATGALIRAEVNIKNFFNTAGFGASKAQMRVYFKEDPKLKFWVPARLTERYDIVGFGQLTGDATYTNYRQFGTETKEEFVPPAIEPGK
jgi:hypothetical protein